MENTDLDRSKKSSIHVEKVRFVDDDCNDEESKIESLHNKEDSQDGDLCDEPWNTATSQDSVRRMPPTADVDSSAAAAVSRRRLPSTWRRAASPTTTTTTTAQVKSFAIRRKSEVDITTGNIQDHKCLCQPIYSDEYYLPMDPFQRFWKQLSRGRRKQRDQQHSPTATICQYRLTSQRKSRNVWRRLKSASEEEFHVAQGLRIWIANYLHWTFRNSFLLLFITVTVFYLTGIMIFAGLIYFSAWHLPYCITVGTYHNYDEAGNYFIDAISLSWNSFSTVGYGAAYPSLKSASGSSCVGINTLIAVESFAGIIFVSFIGAVVYSKVARIQCVANVDFSDPIVIRYGTGTMVVVEPDEPSEVSSEGGEGGDKQQQQQQVQEIPKKVSRRSLVQIRSGQIHCPVLEFRVVNRMHDLAGGEICNAVIKVMASTLATRASHKIRAEVTAGKRASQMAASWKRATLCNNNNASFRQSMSSSFNGSIMLSSNNTQSIISKSERDLLLTPVPEDEDEENGNYDGSLFEWVSAQDLELGSSQHPATVVAVAPIIPVSVIQASRQHVEVDEEPTGELIPRRIFSTLDIETDQHPFFKRVWNIRHVLSETSPLLSGKAKRLIEENGGFWPNELNSHEQVRKHLHFHQIIATFSGTANVSGSAVYAQKVYDFVDVNVGYRFAQVLYKDELGNIGVDINLLNDVTEQLGGGAEPFLHVKGNIIPAASSSWPTEEVAPHATLGMFNPNNVATSMRNLTRSAGLAYHNQ